MPPKKQGPGRPPKHGPARKGVRSGKRLTADVDPVIARALAGYIAARFKKDRLRLTRTQVIEQALMRFLEAEKYWPPK